MAASPATRPSWGSRAPLALGILGLIVLCIWCLRLLTLNETQPQTALSPVSDVASIQQDLFMITVWAGAAVAILVEGALIYTLWRFRAKAGEGRPKQIHGSTKLEITWTIIPFFILLGITVPTVKGIFDTAKTAPSNSLHIRAVGHQWWWEFQYTDSQTGFVTANEVHVPTDRVVSFQLATADVIHSFWIPKMGGKRDNIPNHVNNLWFTTPKKPGVFPGQCAEFCGVAHAYMSMKLFVDTPADYAAWVSRQRVAAPTPAAALEQRGATVFMQSGCIACHALMGTVGQGTMGPSLSHVGSRSSIGGVLLANTAANMALWIHDPGALKPGALMPPQPLAAADLKAVVAYLESRK